MRSVKRTSGRAPVRPISQNIRSCDDALPWNVIRRLRVEVSWRLERFGQTRWKAGVTRCGVLRNQHGRGDSRGEGQELALGEAEGLRACSPPSLVVLRAKCWLRAYGPDVPRMTPRRYL